MPEVKGKDWTPAIIGVGAIGMVGLGVYFWMRKVAFGAGDKIKCIYVYNHSGKGGDYVFRVEMGHLIGIKPLWYFNSMVETRQEFIASVKSSIGFESKTTEVIYEVPENLAPDKYDLQASVRNLDSSMILGMNVVSDDIIQVK